MEVEPPPPKKKEKKMNRGGREVGERGTLLSAEVLKLFTGF